MRHFSLVGLFCVFLVVPIRSLAQTTDLFGRTTPASPSSSQTPLSGTASGSAQSGAMGSSTGIGTGSGVAPTPLFPGPGDSSGATPLSNRPRGASPGSVNQQRTDRIGDPSERQQDRLFSESKEPRTEFQDFILQSTGRELPIFGSELFRNVPSTFAPVDDVPVTPDYVIGPGDEILIRAWGQIDVDYTAVVDRNGLISVPKVGVFNVAGITYGNLTNFLKSSFGRIFRNFELTATLGRLRSIQVFVVGQARRPGSYTLGSSSTLVNALFAVGGPASSGSMRNIQLKRGNKIVTHLDLYDLLIFGDKSKDAQLLPGDVIYIPPVGKLVAITGSVNVPAIFELKQDAPLSDLIQWAGGLSTTARGQKAAVERIDGRSGRRVEEFALDLTGLSRAVRDGDLVRVYPVLPKFDNAVILRGNVAQPGRFPWRAGLRVRDLIPEKEVVVSREYWNKRNQAVGLDQDMLRILRQQNAAAPQFELADLLERRMKESEDLTIAAAIRRRQIENEATRLVQPSVGPDSAAAPDPTIDSSRLLNQIRPPAKEVNWDYALIERLDPRDLSTVLLPFNLGKAILDADPQHNLLLQPNDVITVFSKEDLQVSALRQTKFVRLEGEFISPGVYQIQPGETLRQLVVRVGGVAAGAYLFGAEFTRESTRKIQSVQYQEALNRIEREMESDLSMRAKSTTEDLASLPALRESRIAQIKRLRALKPSGRIVLELPDHPRLADLPDVPLEDGDRLFIPPAPSMVSVYGSVFTETSFLYRPEKKVADYISQAGGPTKRADTSQVFILRADGSVTGSKQSWLGASLTRATVLRGDTIIVPEDYERVPFMKSLRDWSQILYQFGLGAAALKVLQN